MCVRSSSTGILVNSRSMDSDVRERDGGRRKGGREEGGVVWSPLTWL